MTKNEDALYLMFPAALRYKLISKELQFPEHTEYSFAAIPAYRCIERSENDYTQVNRNDFLSHIEKGVQPRKPRGKSIDIEQDIGFYAASLYKKKEIVENVMHMPRKTKKICCGWVFMEAGPQATDDQHINWWLFEDADLSNFKIL